LSFNYIDIIELFANKYGGAHFPKSVEKLKGNINKAFSSNPIIQDSYFYPIAKLVTELSTDIIKNVFDFSFFKYLYIPSQEIQGSKILFEYKHKFSHQRIRFFLKENYRIEIQIIDINNKFISFSSKNPMPINEPFFLAFISEMTPNFRTEFILVINESLECKVETNILHELRNDLANHSITYNMDSVGNLSSLKFALMTGMIGYKKSYNYSKYSEIYSFMKHEWFEKSSKFNCFNKNNTANRNAKQHLHFSHNLPELSIEETKNFYKALK